MVPFAAGSATDIVARLIADDLRAALGQGFVTDNKPGAAARIGAAAVATAPADGDTRLVTTNTSHSANPHLFKKLSYDPIRDLAPAGTPPEIDNRLSAEVRKSLARPEVRERVAGFAADVAPSSPEQLAALVRAQLGSWGRRIRDTGIEPE